MNKSLLCSLVLLVVFLFASTVSANSCTKTFTVKGKDYKFDLNGLSSTAGYQAKGADGYNYYISFCSAVTAPAASCAKDGSYKGWQLSDDKNNCFPIAMGGDDGVSMELIDPDNVEGGILIKMKTVDGTYNRGAEIQLSCQKKTKIGDVSVTEKKDGLYTSIYHFNMKSSYACIGGGSSGGRKCALGCVYGVGGLLMTLSLVALILYFIIGFVLCKFVWKKEGMEVIPNVEFWKDLPFLLKDGAMFWVDLVRSVTKKGQYTEVTA